jgi:hypothetical protein
MISAMNTTESVLAVANDADDKAVHDLDADNPQHAEVWAQLATARSIAALTLAVQNIADAINFHAKP